MLTKCLAHFLCISQVYNGTKLIPHPIQPRQYLRVGTAGSGAAVPTFEVPDEILVGVGGERAGAGGGLDGVEGLGNAVFGDALYILSYDGHVGRSAHEARMTEGRRWRRCRRLPRLPCRVAAPWPGFSDPAA